MENDAEGAHKYMDDLLREWNGKKTMVFSIPSDKQLMIYVHQSLTTYDRHEAQG